MLLSTRYFESVFNFFLIFFRNTCRQKAPIIAIKMQKAHENTLHRLLYDTSN